MIKIEESLDRLVEAVLTDLSQDALGDAQGRIVTRFGGLSLEEEELMFLCFDEALYRLLYTPKDAPCDKIQAAVRTVMAHPDLFATNRFTKRYFWRLADHAGMCLKGCSSLAPDIQRIARKHGCDDDQPQVYDALAQALKRESVAA